MTEIKTKINGFEIELHLSDDKLGVDWSDCYVVKGEYSGTLAFLEGYGFLVDSNDIELEVPVNTIKTIGKWAEQNGY